MKKKNVNKIKPRNSSALSAKSRVAGMFPMKDRRTPRAGAKNDQPDFLNELDFKIQYEPGYEPEVTEEDIKEHEQAMKDAIDDYVKDSEEEEHEFDNL